MLLGFNYPDGWTTGSLELEVRSKSEPEKRMPITTSFLAIPDCLDIVPEDAVDNKVTAQVTLKPGANLPSDDRVKLRAEADPAPGLGAALAATPGLPGFAMKAPFEKLTRDIEVQLVPYMLFVNADMPGEEPEDPTSPQRICKGDTLEQVSDELARIVVRARLFRVDADGCDQGDGETGIEWSCVAKEAGDYFEFVTMPPEEGGKVYCFGIKSVLAAPPPRSGNLRGRTTMKLRLEARTATKAKVWMEFAVQAQAEQAVGSFSAWVGRKQGKYDYLTRLLGQASSEADLGQQLGRLCPSELRQLNKMLTAYETHMTAYVQAHPKVWDSAPGGVRNFLNWFGQESNKVRGCVDMSMQAERALLGAQQAGKSQPFEVFHYGWDPGTGRQVGAFFGIPVSTALLTYFVGGAKVGALAGPWGLIAGGLAGGAAVLITHNTEHNMSCLQLKRDPEVRIVFDPHAAQNGHPESVHGPSYFQGILTGATLAVPDVGKQDWELPPPPASPPSPGPGFPVREMHR